MDFVHIAGFGRVPIAAQDGARREGERIGDVERAFDGSAVSSITGYKDRWPLRTTPLLRADAEQLVGVLRTVPVQASGTYFGRAVECIAEDVSDQPLPGDRRRVVSFTLREA